MGFVAWKNSRIFAMQPLVPREMTSEKRAQKFHTDDASDWLKQIFRGPLAGKPPWSRREM